MAVTNNRYNQNWHLGLNGTLDYDTDSFIIILMNSSHVFTATNTAKADINANQIATAFGYTQDTKALATVTMTETPAGRATWDAADVTWTASGGAIAATDAVIYDDTATSPLDALITSIDFDGLQSAGDTTDFKITWNTAGILYVGA